LYIDSIARVKMWDRVGKSEDACYSVNDTIARVKMCRMKGLPVAVPRLWSPGDKYFDT
jgi:hypothetical protein